MKKQAKRLLLILGLCGTMSLTMYGCGSENLSSEEEQTEPLDESQEEPKEAPDADAPEESKELPGAEDQGGPKELPGAEDPKEPKGVSGADNPEETEEGALDSEKETGTGTRERKEGAEDLVGEIKEMGDGQFTVVESIAEEAEGGGQIMAAPAPDADDSDFEKVVVTYDENTDIYIRTIYDNGARYEDTDAGADDLKKGVSVNIWGVREGDGNLQADQIQIDVFVR